MTAATLVDPAYCTHPPYVRTDGPEVAELCEAVGFGPDPGQRRGLDLIFGVDAAGRSAAFEICVVCARQNMKTGLFKQAVIGWLWLLDQRLVIWSAHEFSTAQEAFRDLDELVTGSDLLRRRVKAIHRGNGEEAIELVGDRRLKFKARTKGGGRGLTGDKVILDESMYLLPPHMGALMPTLSARKDPQVLYGASAGLAESAVLRGVRDRGRVGTGRLAYMEYCDDLDGACQLGESCDHRVGSPGCRLDDEARWARANPQMGGRITVEYLRAERQALPPDEFGRERLGWWDDPDEDEDELLAKWAAGTDPDSAPTGRPAYCVDVSPGSKSAAIVAALRRSDGQAHVEVVEHRPGVDWVLDRCVELLVHKPVGWVIDPSSPVGALDWDGAGFTKRPLTAKTPSGPRDVTELVGRDMGQACESFAAAPPRHLGDARLLAALQGASRRDVGDGLWMWSRKRSGVDISPLVGATGALWGLATLTPATPFFGAWR